MGIFSIFSKIGGLFRRKKKIDEDILKNLPPSPTAGMPVSPITSEGAATENVKARMDLVLTQMDSLRVQYETLNSRVANIEKMLKELYDMAKSQ